MNQFWKDVLHGARALRKNPGFTAVAALTLALGIGANATVFSWMNSTLLMPIPGASETSRLVAVERGLTNTFSYPDYLALREHNRSFSGLLASTLWPMSVTGQDRPERVWGMLVSANYFDLLGVKPVLGRSFLPVEDATPNGAPVAVLGYRLWQDRFGGRQDVLGSTIPLNAHPYTIVGVAPPEFQGSFTGLRAEIWVPVMMAPQLIPGLDNRLDARGETWLNVVGRLRPGADRVQAQAELSAVWAQIAQQYPETHKGRALVTLYPMWKAPNSANGLFSKLLPLLLGIGGVVLLLACANLANLVLARGVTRRKEMAIRLSLGAGRARLVRQLLAENLALALLGGLLAFAVTIWTAKSFMHFAPVSSLPIWLPTSVDYRVFGFTLALSVVAMVLFGSLPAVRASQLDPVSSIKEEGSASGGRSSRLSGGLASAQIALSLILLVCAVLLIRSFRAMQEFNPGFNPRGVQLQSYDLYPAGYSEARGIAFNRSVLEKAAALPGVTHACLADWVPFGFTTNSQEFVPEGYAAGAQESIEAGVAHVSPGYFATMEIPLLSGRDFSSRDSADSQPVVIVNQLLAERYWPGQQAVGKRMKIAGKWAVVAGVVKTAHYYEPDEDPRTFVYLPLEQFYTFKATLHLRSTSDPRNLAAAAAQLIHQEDASLPVFDVATLEARTEAVSFGLRLAGTFVGAFALIAVVLASVGIYGVVAYSMERRTREMGIRMALGAQPGDVLRLILRQSARMLLGGAAAGVLGALGAARLFSRALFGVTPTDPLTFSSVTLLLLAVALTACYLPARRAVRLDPLVALRHE